MSWLSSSRVMTGDPAMTTMPRRLNGLLSLLERHQDSVGRPAVLTADMVLAVPNTMKIRSEGFSSYRRRYLDEGFEAILAAVRTGMAKGVLVPQLHGIEHLHGDGLVKLGRDRDQRVANLFDADGWSDWESLDSPLQAHYVDGTQLPTTPLPEADRRSAGQRCMRSL